MGKNPWVAEGWSSFLPDTFFDHSFDNCTFIKIKKVKMISIGSSLINKILFELTFTSSRSSGPGGQNVNKVNSKVTLQWNVQSSVLTGEEKEVIQHKLATYITKEGVLQLTSQEARSQLQNKEAVVQKLEHLLTKAFTKKKARKPTKPSKAAKQKRILQKKLQGEKKKWRQKGGD
jgi:ribosome-associated protein